MANNRAYFTVLHSDIIGLSEADKDELFNKDYGDANKGIVLQTSTDTLRCSLDEPKECILKCLPQRTGDFMVFTISRSIARTVFTHATMLFEIDSTKWNQPLEE